MLSLTMLLILVPAAERDWSIEIKDRGTSIVVGPLSPGEAGAWLSKPPRDPGQILSLYVGTGDLPMLGEWKIEKQTLVFVPRFPLAPGVAYRAVLNPSRLPGFPATNPGPITKNLMIPKPPRGPATFVEQVYPTGNVLPENQLKFYLHFSAPMRTGDAYRYARLLDAQGKRIEGAFIEIDQELWDRETRRLTLLFDPGRIKRGLKPREEDGPILEEGKSYTLVIDPAWKDAEGEPLRQEFRKTFKAVAPDDTQPDPANWKITSPTPGTREPVTVSFPESLDHALLQRLVWIETAAGQRIAGKLSVGKLEQNWLLEPEQAWVAGDYRLVADKRLEDLAGNSIGRPFEVDLFRPVQREIKAETVAKSFRVGK